MNGETRRAACWGAAWMLVIVTSTVAAAAFVIRSVADASDMVLLIACLLMVGSWMVLCTMAVLRKLDGHGGYAAGYRDGMADANHLRSVTKITTAQR